MKVYTRTGDGGETGLFGGNRVPKTHPRVKAYGTLDELCSFLGMTLNYVDSKEVTEFTVTVQRHLFTLGSWLASPKACENLANGKDAFGGDRKERTHLDDDTIKTMEKQIDEWEDQLEPMTAFILPGGSKAGAMFHYARTICRRAERDVISTTEAGENVPPEVLVYLNRLSDALFVLGRFVNHKSGQTETQWS